MAGESGDNLISSARLVDEGYVPASLRDVAWTSDCWSATHDAGNEPQRARLAELGISVSCEGGRLEFGVSDASLFRPGIDVPIGFTVYPGGRRLSAVVRTGEDLAVKEKDGKSLFKSFCVAQKRSFSFQGFSGGRIYYLSDQDACGPITGAPHACNRQWKTDRSDSAPLVYCKLDTDGGILYPHEAPDAYADQSLAPGESLDIYAVYPNVFDVTEGYRSKDGKVIICSDDVHNDGVIEMPLRVRLPYFDGYTHLRIFDLTLPIDGTEVALRHPFYDHFRGIPLWEDDFDPVLYDKLVRPTIKWDAALYPWAECVKMDGERNSIYIEKTTMGGNRIEDTEFGEDIIVELHIELNPATGLYSTLRHRITCYVSRPTLPKALSLSNNSYFSGAKGKGKIQLLIPCEFEGADMSAISVKDAGPAMSFTCEDDPSCVIKPEVDVYLTSDHLCYSYDESKQATTSPRGTPVPGGLVVPYGKHRLTLSFPNKWDKRQIQYNCDFTLNYGLYLYQFAVFPSSRYGTIYLLPQKNIDYLLAMSGSVGKKTRDFMIRVLGVNGWHARLSTQHNFLDAQGHYHQNDRIDGYPRNDYDVAFLGTGKSRWTAEQARLSFEGDYMWLNYLDLLDADRNIIGNKSIEPHEFYTGNEHVRVSGMNTSKAGYVFMNGFL